MWFLSSERRDALSWGIRGRRFKSSLADHITLGEASLFSEVFLFPDLAVGKKWVKPMVTMDHNPHLHPASLYKTRYNKLLVQY